MDWEWDIQHRETSTIPQKARPEIRLQQQNNKKLMIIKTITTVIKINNELILL